MLTLLGIQRETLSKKRDHYSIGHTQQSELPEQSVCSNGDVTGCTTLVQHRDMVILLHAFPSRLIRSHSSFVLVATNGPQKGYYHGLRP